ncbi:MAG: YraN family protein [Candidatus Synoicihabitans palmerolidicus]|nr:YraN family protein [Candidatus Synoicihabitans palmerolidicus]
MSQRPEKIDRGASGEHLAEGFLRNEYGFRLLVRNWRNPRDRRDEIDLVMRDGEILVFVEVKPRVEGGVGAGLPCSG